jgi:hypothetical protein
MKRTRPQYAPLVATGLALAALFASTLASGQEAPAKAETAAVPGASPAEKSPAVTGLRLDVRPIITRKDAIAYAKEWLVVTALKGMVPGKLHEEGNLYIVDLVDGVATKRLRNQLLIRKQDGLAILVYPANLNTPAAEKMVGMQGLEGMAGATGTRGAVQRSGMTHDGNYAITTAKSAQRGIDAWLWINGLPSLHSSHPRNLGGIFAADILDDQGAKKNQVVVRKADGYVQMINPVRLPMLAAPGNDAGKK